MGNLEFVLSRIEFIIFIVPCALNRLNYFLSFSVAPISSCKEQFDKDK